MTAAHKSCVFAKNFSQEIQTISLALNSDPFDIISVRKQVSELQDQVSNAIFLPEYDVEKYLKEIKCLKAKVEQKAPVKKFCFGQRTTKPVQKQQEQIIKETCSKEKISGVEVYGNTVQIQNCSNQTLEIKEKPEYIRIKNVMDCIICFPETTASVMISESRNSVFVFKSCHQLRIHSSSNLIVAAIVKDPIIEDCDKMQFVSLGQNELNVKDFNNLQPGNQNWKIGPDCIKTWIQEHNLDQLITYCKTLE